MISFMIMWILRIYDTKKYIKIDIDKSKIVVNIIIIGIQIGILFSNIGLLRELSLLILVFFIQLYFNKHVLLLFLSVVRRYRK